MDDQLSAVYHRHVGMAYDRQERFLALLTKQADGEWNYDPATATFTYGKLTLEAPVIGTHQKSNDAWLWAWSDKHLKLTLTNRALGDTVRALVHKLSIHELGAPGFSLEPLFGEEHTGSAAHILGVILTAELGYDAFHTLSYDYGRQLILIRDDRLKKAEKRPLVRVAQMFPLAIKEMIVLDHKEALAAYAQDYNLTVNEVPEGLKITDGGKETLTATFDERGKLKSLDGVTLPKPKAPAPSPSKKPTTKKPATKQPAKKAPAKAAAKKPTAKVARPAAKNTAKTTTAKKPAAKKPTAKQPATKKPATKKPATKKR